MFIPDPESDFFPFRIPDPNCFHLGSRIRVKEFKYFNPKKWFLSSRKYDPGCSSRIPVPGVRIRNIDDDMLGLDFNFYCQILYKCADLDRSSSLDLGDSVLLLAHLRKFPAELRPEKGVAYPELDCLNNRTF
jgi:hypothetical protein